MARANDIESILYIIMNYMKIFNLNNYYSLCTPCTTPNSLCSLAFIWSLSKIYRVFLICEQCHELCPFCWPAPGGLFCFCFCCSARSLSTAFPASFAARLAIAFTPKLLALCAVSARFPTE